MIDERPTNWARNVTFSTSRIHRPSSVPELQELVAGSASVRALGSGHSFNEIADTRGVLVSVDALSLPVTVDRQASTVTVGAGVRYTELCRRLAAAGLALPNLGSLPHITVAGACATATHGSGDRNGNLATAVSAVEMVTADGELVTVRRDGDGERFAGAVVALGALGIVVRLTLDVVLGFGIRQWVYEGLAWDTVTSRLPEIFASGYSVSAFTDWRGDRVNQVWVKRRDDDPRAPAPDLFGARPADGPRHPIGGMPVENCTTQLGEPGPWHARLPHFRAEFTPSSGAELQSEYLIPREHAAVALEALAELRDLIAPVVQVGELRTVAQDQLWLSPSYHRHVLGVHFTWVPDFAAVRPVLSAIEEKLAPFDARPHWGKLFTVRPEVIQGLYPRLPDFISLAVDYDPDGKFRNDFLRRYLFAG